jgi:flagellar operon protein (TIGR03826 family)
MPDIRNCRRCGKVYTYLGGAPICPECKASDEEDFKRVKDFLYENPGASLSVVSRTLDIGIEKIKRFLKEGRIEIVGDGANLFLECERCGKSIKSGRYCDSCERELVGNLKSAAGQLADNIQSEVPRRTGGVRYLSKEVNQGKGK